MTGSHSPRPRPLRRPRPAPAAVTAGGEAPAPAHPGRRRRIRPAYAFASLALLALVAVDTWLAVVHADRRHAAHAARREVITVAGRQPIAEAAAERAAIAAADRRIPAMLSYDYRQVDGYVSQAPANATGSFRTEFARRIRKVIAPAATKDQVTTTAEIKTVGVMDVRTDRVQLLVFIDQTTTSRTNQIGRVDAGRLEVTMTRTGDTWLVSDLTAV